jgi:WD40 repeat protein
MRSLENSLGSATAHFWYLGRALQQHIQEDEDQPDPSETPHIVLRDPAGAADAFAMSPNRRFVVARSLSSLLVWDLLKDPAAYAMGMVPTTLRGHDALLLAVAFTPDGRWLVSRDLEQGVRL